MRILLTGANGTVGGAVRRAADVRGWTVVAWDRALNSPEDAGAIERIVAGANADGILHLAMGAPSWAALLARLCAASGTPYVYTSTASVFAAPGPHHPTDERTATDDYGRYKADCEDAVTGASREAAVVRLGYQISLSADGNNLGAHLRNQAAEGPIRASAAWIPATSLLEDTAEVLLDLLAAPQPGLHHLDANAHEAWNYPQIVAAIISALGADWPVEVTQDRVEDQRLLDSLPIARLSQRLPDLGAPSGRS